MTVAAVGIPTLLHWHWTGRAHPLSYSYNRTLLCLLRWFGTAYALVAGMLLVIASADLLFGRGLGYQVWVPLFCAAMIAVGLIVRWLAGLWLERQRAERTTFSDGRRGTLSCPDPQLQMALRGVVRAIEQLPSLDKPQIAAVEGSEATIEAFRRLTTSFFGLLSFNLPSAADAVQVKRATSTEAASPTREAGPRGVTAQAAGLTQRDYVPLGVAIFVDLCLLLVLFGRPINSFRHLEQDMRLAERGPVLPILARFHDIHSDHDAVRYFEVFRDVIFDAGGNYYVAVPLKVPDTAENREELEREAHRLANLCYALEGKGILQRPRRAFGTGFVVRQLKQRGSKFVQCYGSIRPPRYRRSWHALRSVWAETPEVPAPAFKVYRFKKGAWPEMILQAVLRAARDSEAEKGQPGRPLRRKEGAHDQTLSLPSPKPRIAAQLGAVHEKSTS
jgi:hypothetical protein